MSEFSDWVRKRYLNPVVVVESTASADAVTGRNGLDVVQLLRRYSSVAGPLQANLGEKGETVVVRCFGVRLQRTDCVREVSPSQILRHVRHQIWRMAEMDLVCGEQLDRVLHDKLMESVQVTPATASAASSSSPEHTASASVTAGEAAASVVGPSPRPQRIAVNTTSFNTLLERSRPPWHGSVVRDLHYLVRATSFETLDYPVGVLYVVSTGEPGGVDGVLRAIRGQMKRLHDMRMDLVGMETDLHSFYILLHDLAAPSSTTTLRDAQAILTAMKQLYGDTYCTLVKLNSGAVDGASHLPTDPTPWVDANPACMDVPAYTALVREQTREANRPDAAAAAASKTSSVPTSLQYRTVKTHFTGTTSSGSSAAREKLTTGCYLTRDDLSELEGAMAYYVGQSLFRYLERRHRGLDVAVQDRRTTTLRKVAAWLSLKDESKPRAASVVNAPDGTAPRYLATSVEMQMRRCGDLSLAFHHYEMAAEYYKMCMEELIQSLPDRPYNKAMIAACQEAIGITLLMQDKLPLPTATPWTVTASWTSTRSHSACRLELAQPMFVGAGLPLNALRLSLMMSEFCRTRMPPAMDRTVGQLKHILRSGLIGRTPLFLALIHDMLASAYIFTNPPYPSGLLLPPSLPVSSEGLPVYSYIRRFVANLATAGQHYLAEGVMECALRCFLRVLEVFRSLGKARAWPELYERLLDRISTLYYTLGYDVKGLAMSSVAVLQGCRKYSDPVSGYSAFEHFWRRQEQVLTSKGFGLSAHMVVPEVVRPSVTIRRNTYGVDADTYHITRLLGDVAASSEWRVMEHQLRSTMLRRLAQHEARATAAASTTNEADPFASARATHQTQPRLVLHLPRGSHGVVRQLANDDVVVLARTTTATATSPGAVVAASSAVVAAGTKSGWGDSFIVTGHAHVVRTGSASAATSPHFRMYLGEPLKVSVELYNPVGAALTATNMCLLYVARGGQGAQPSSSPPPLWKTASTQTVTIPAQSRTQVNLSFDPVQEGAYVIIGLCWSILGQEGYYYFATRESRPGCTESLFEYAMAHPMPNPDAPENVCVVVEPPEAWLASTFDPPLPSRMRDGEYFHTTLSLANKSTRGTARHITLQRSPQNAHLIFIGEFGLEKNLSEETAFDLAEDLAPGQVKKLSVVFRAQHDRGDAALTCYNHLFLLFGFVSDAGAVHAPGLAASTTMRVIDVRVHRLLRRVEVTPLLLLYSTVLPPTGPSLDTACVLTVKHIPAPTKPSTASVSRRQTHDAPGEGTECSVNRPVSVARVLVMHEPRWELHLAQDVETLLQCHDDSAACVMPPGSSLTMPIMVHRKDAGGTTANDSVTSAGAVLLNHVLVSGDDDNDEVPEEAPLKDTECLPLRRVLKSDTQACFVETVLGKTLSPTEGTGKAAATTSSSNSTSAASAFFLQTFFRGAGGVGSNAVDAKAGMEAMAFYKDKAGSAEAVAIAQRTPAQRRQQERQQEAAMYGAPLETYSPIAVAVAWVLLEDDCADDESGNAGAEAKSSASISDRPGGVGGRVVCGQSFFLIDAMAFLDHCTCASGDGAASALVQSFQFTSDKDSFACNNNSSLSSAVAATGIAERTAAASTESVATLQEQQTRLSQALWSRNSPRGDRGALVYKVSVPLSAEATPSMPTVALAPVTFTCLSLSPVPLMVEICAHTLGDDAQPVLFVGKTREAFYLPPSARHSVTLTAHVLMPGVVDCNRVRVRAAPLLFQPAVPAVRTGMSAAAFLRALRADQEGVNTSSYDSAVVRRRGNTSSRSASAVASPHHALDLVGEGATTHGKPVHTAAAAQTRAALHSLVAAQSRRRSVELGPTAYSRVSPTAPAGGAHHHDATHDAAVEIALGLLMPRGFPASHVVVVGAEVPALVHVTFPRMDASTQAAAATVFQRKNTVYHRDCKLFAANYAKFNKAQAAAWLEKSATADTAQKGVSEDVEGSRVHYVYRPRVKKAVEATGTGPVQFDDLDKLLASPHSGAVSELNGSLPSSTHVNGARSGPRATGPSAAVSPPLKGSPSTFSGSASGGLGHSLNSSRPRPPRLLLPQPLQVRDSSASGLSAEAPQVESAAHNVPDALFASPILHAAPPLASSAQKAVGSLSSPPPPQWLPPAQVPVSTPAPRLDLDQCSTREAMGGDEDEEQDERPLPDLVLGDDSEPTSAYPSGLHSALLSPLHIPSPHRGFGFEHVMPVDSVRDRSEADVAAAAEGLPETTIMVPAFATNDGGDDANDAMEAYLRQSTALVSPDTPLWATTKPVNAPLPVSLLDDTAGAADLPSTPQAVLSRVVEHRAVTHPLTAEDVHDADLRRGMRELPASRTGVVVVTGTPVRAGGRATPARGVSVSATGVDTSPGAEESAVLTGTPVHVGVVNAKASPTTGAR